MPNSHIHDFILDYCLSEAPPNYAILLKGPWGVGKTWFIKKAIQNINNKNVKELYISLYGINSFSAIEYEFYRTLHPILSSKGMDLAGKIIRGTLKATLKIDINSDGKDDASTNISIPDINLPEYLKNTSDLVLIFDDIERCSIATSDLLGYINHFVEHQNYKVILVANEAELEKNEKYRIIKEKLIGKTFEITPELDLVLDKFTSDTRTEKFYNPHLDLIKQTYSQSKYGNLRHLRQALLDFTRLEQKLPHEVTDSQELVAHLLQLLLIFTFEIRHGEISAKDISSFKFGWLSQISSSATEEKTAIAKLTEKYPRIKNQELLLDADLWIEILDKGIINDNLITKQLKNTKYLISKKTPNWIKLWNFRTHTNETFKELTNEVWTHFRELKFLDPQEIKHISGMMMFFSSKKSSKKAFKKY
ncbi:P-loop NTPase fold protein [Pseudomonas chlororaphis]|uniref:P-loop NTPase fold protein n=1 Tax=Pseudomonas chlororaphis TaxID=587753 RepID=UPI0039E17429